MKKTQRKWTTPIHVTRKFIFRFHIRWIKNQHNFVDFFALHSLTNPFASPKKRKVEKRCKNLFTFSYLYVFLYKFTHYLLVFTFTPLTCRSCHYLSVRILRRLFWNSFTSVSIDVGITLLQVNHTFCTKAKQQRSTTKDRIWFFTFHTSTPQHDNASFHSFCIGNIWKPRNSFKMFHEFVWRKSNGVECVM